MCKQNFNFVLKNTATYWEYASFSARAKTSKMKKNKKSFTIYCACQKKVVILQRIWIRVVFAAPSDQIHNTKSNELTN